MNDSPNMVQLSVLCLTPDHLVTLAPLLHALEAQTIARQLEIVLMAPAATTDEPVPGAPDRFARIVRANSTPGATNPEIRAEAVRLASAPYIVFTEDHCFPEPEWAASLVAALDAGAMGAGPLMVNANPDHPTSCVNFLLEYGPWSYQDAAGHVRHLPGHNSAYRREWLLSLGEGLAQTLQLESPWLWEQSGKGAVLQCVAGARSHHFNFSMMAPALPLRFHGGRVYGATRAASWAITQRLLYAGSLPLIILIRWWRALRQAQHCMADRMTLGIHLRIPLLLSADSLGEVCGYLFGAGSAMQHISGLEFHRGRFTRGVPVVPAEWPR